MESSKAIDRKVRILLVFFSLYAFLSIFAALDTSEQYRAWKTSLRWTDEQKSAAPAMDAAKVHPVTLLALAVDTSIIVVSFLGFASLGTMVSTDKGRAFSAVLVLTWTNALLGIGYSLLMFIYGELLGSRTILKGPIYDYDLRFQIPVIVAMAGYPVVFAVVLLKLSGMKALPSKSPMEHLGD